ncbi:RNA 2',3'-cyclic phosphodiesterase [Halomonas sp. BM-2019]|uniref:RNA 2',3'-cyclic phosphodiesterase n=1 Tax=Halomonas sp. BM-2019 TaxID=2811227 RepID=UPI001B3C3717|nr:MAG: RNA 2',3'-cyclic phosphodiesterase [Halomonas sp. BM-2019]
MRLFLALVPPPGLRERLGQLADAAHARCGGRRMPDESLHLTLAFLGEVSEAQATELVEWVGRLAVPPGEWRLDAWGHFHRPGIVWVGGQASDPALTALHGRLWEALEGRRFAGRPARYVPHVTLLRRARRFEPARLPAPALRWRYNRLHLIQSLSDDRGSRYVSLARSR